MDMLYVLIQLICRFWRLKFFIIDETKIFLIFIRLFFSDDISFWIFVLVLSSLTFHIEELITSVSLKLFSHCKGFAIVSELIKIGTSSFLCHVLINCQFIFLVISRNRTLLKYFLSFLGSFDNRIYRVNIHLLISTVVFFVIRSLIIIRDLIFVYF